MLTEKELDAISKIFDEKFDPIAASLNVEYEAMKELNRKISDYLSETEITRIGAGFCS